jgi:polar amino acid transport system substrate-binding protein
MTPLQRIAGLCQELIVVMFFAIAAPSGLAHARPLESIQNRGVLVICANPNALPFASKGGNRRGFELELGEALASQLGVKLEVGWVVFPNQLGRVDCDVVLDAIVDQASAQERHVKLSKPYQASGVAIALRPDISGVADFADLRGRRVGAMVGSLASVTLGQKGLPTIPFTFEDDMIEAVGKGELDAALATPASIGYYNLLHKDAPVTLVRAYENQPEFRWEIAVGMRKSDDALVAAINQAIERLLADGTVDRIYASYGIEPAPPKGQ